jgi:YcxB-like protein
MYEWPHFDRFAETPNLYILSQIGKAGTAVPKRAFSSEAVRLEFADRLRRHLPRATNEVRI